MFRIKGNNVFGYKEIEFDFANKGLVLIQGENRDNPSAKSNAAGKTSLIDVLCWGLYGECLKINDPKKVVNRKAGKDCEVHVYWGEWHVIRYREHTQFKNDVQLFENNIPITAKSNIETQKLIDKAVGLSYESFRNSVYFQQLTLTSFATAKDSKQKEIIEDILGLNALSLAQEVAKGKVKTFMELIEKEQNKIKEKEIAAGEIERNIKQMCERSIVWEKQRNNTITSEEQKKQGFEAELLKDSEPFDFATAKATVALAVPIAKEIDGCEASIRALLKEKSTHASSRQVWEFKIKTAENVQLKHIAEKQKLESGVALKCPTCGKDMDTSATVKRLADVEDLIKENLKTITDGKAALEKVPNDQHIDDQIKELNDKISSKKQIVLMADKVKLIIAKEEYKLAAKQTLMERIKECEDKIKELKTAINPYSSDTSKETTRLNEIKTAIVSLEASVENFKIDSSYYEYWVDGLSNRRLKSYIMDSITPILNERANYYSKYLTSGSVDIEISTQTKLKSGELRDKFSVNTTTIDGEDYETSSGGFRKRIDICILLALQDLVSSRAAQPIKLLIMDEVSENLDSVGIERMLELLKSIAVSKGSCFYVTHHSDMQALFPNTITIVKENGVSSIQ